MTYCTHPNLLRVVACISLTLGLHARADVNVTQWHNDAAHTGQNLEETQLTISNVNPNSFGKLFSYPVDGFVYAQPLYVSNVPVPDKGARNLVFVVTEHDSVYAFDADDGSRDGGAAVWKVSFANPAFGISSVPTTDLGFSNPELAEVGVTGTPVIDLASGTLYVLAHTKEIDATGQVSYPQKLHALDVATGAEKFGGPVQIRAFVAGKGSNVNDQGQVVFTDEFEFQRPGLILVNGVVYAGFASVGDVGPYHGWIIGFDAHTLHQIQTFNDTPNGIEGGIWMSGSAPSADSQGNLYCITGNGDFDPSASDYGDSFLKLTPSGTNLVVSDYFAPFDQALLASADGDLGSGGAMLLPDSAGSTLHPHLLIGCGKEGSIYLLDRDNLGHFNPVDNSQIVQFLPGTHGIWGSPAFFNGWIYYQPSEEPLEAFSISDGQMSTVPVSQNSASIWSYPGGTPSISANGTNNAIVWLLQTDTFYQSAPAILHAYNATNLEEELYNSDQADQRDKPGLAQKFSVPVIANGKVYVGGGSSLTVYGRLGGLTITSEPANQVVLPGSTLALSVNTGGTPPLQYQWRFGSDVLPGATNSTLVLTNLTFAQSGLYSVAITNATGSASSTPAEVLVVEAPSLSIDSDLQMLLTGTGGVLYQIQFADELIGNANWHPLTEIALPGDNSSPELSQASFTAPAESRSHRFYRASAVSLAP